MITPRAISNLCLGVIAGGLGEGLPEKTMPSASRLAKTTMWRLGLYHVIAQVSAPAAPSSLLAGHVNHQQRNRVMRNLLKRWYVWLALFLVLVLMASAAFIYSLNRITQKNL